MHIRLLRGDDALSHVPVLHRQLTFAHCHATTPRARVAPLDAHAPQQEPPSLANGDAAPLTRRTLTYATSLNDGARIRSIDKQRSTVAVRPRVPVREVHAAQGERAAAVHAQDARGAAAVDHAAATNADDRHVAARERKLALVPELQRAACQREYEHLVRCHVRQASAQRGRAVHGLGDAVEGRQVCRRRHGRWDRWRR